MLDSACICPLSHGKITLIQRVRQTMGVRSLVHMAKEMQFQPHTHPKTAAVLKEYH